MHTVNHLIIVLLLCSICLTRASYKEESSDLSASSSSATPGKKSAIKGDGEKIKKSVQFREDTALSTTKEFTKAAYEQEESKVEQDPNTALINFAQEISPKVDAAIATCTDDLLTIWNMFSKAPPDAQAALESFKTIRDHKESYRDHTEILSEYLKQLRTYMKKAKDYTQGDNDTVDTLESLLNSAIDTLHNNAKMLYQQTKKTELDKHFKKIKNSYSLQQQYAQALTFGKDFLQDSHNILGRVDTALRGAAPVGEYKTDHFRTYINAKGAAEKELVIEFVLPYAQKIGVDRNALNDLLIQPIL